jgi:hypothetical protein
MGENEKEAVKRVVIKRPVVDLLWHAWRRMVLSVLQGTDEKFPPEWGLEIFVCL